MHGIIFDNKLRSFYETDYFFTLLFWLSSICHAEIHIGTPYRISRRNPAVLFVDFYSRHYSELCP